MIHLYFALALTLLALVAAGLAVRDYVRQKRSLRPLEAGGTSMTVNTSEQVEVISDAGALSPATTAAASTLEPVPTRLAVYLLAAIIALIAPIPPGIFFKATIGFVLLVFLLMEVIFTVPGTPAILRSGTNSALYFVLWLGFAATTGGELWTVWGLTALIPVALAVIYWWLLRKRLGYLQITVILYILNATLALALATALFATLPAFWTLLALLGTICLVGVDALRGWHDLRMPITNHGLWQMTLCMLATLLLAWSTWGVFLPQLF